MSIEKLGPEAVQEQPSNEETQSPQDAPKVERLKDESLEEVAGGVYCTTCQHYFAG